MPRLARSSLPDGTFHATAHAIEGSNLFRGPGDRRYYLSLLHLATQKAGWRVLAFCLMGNHVHLLLESSTQSLSYGFWLLHNRYAKRYNARHGQGRCLFDGRFYAKPVLSERHRAATVRYLALNPVEAGFSATPEDWHWSSHRPLLGRSTTPPFLAVDRTLDVVGGGDAYFGLVYGEPPPEYLYVRRGATPPPTLDPVLRSRILGADDLELRRLRDEEGLSQSELARTLGVAPSTVKRRIDRAA